MICSTVIRAVPQAALGVELADVCLVRRRLRARLCTPRRVWTWAESGMFPIGPESGSTLAQARSGGTETCRRTAHRNEP
jgi:hypothetical protein